MSTPISIKKIMSIQLVTVGLDDQLSTVKAIFDNLKFHHVLVLDERKLLGIVSDRDLLKALSPNIGTVTESYKDLASLNKRVHQIMTRHPVVLQEEATVDDAIHLFNTQRVSCLPVVDSDGHPIGIVSWRDILKNLRIHPTRRTRSAHAPDASVAAVLMMSGRRCASPLPADRILMNEYDSDKMADVLHASDGLIKTDKPEEADVILLNTCSVREKAQEKVFSDLGRLRELKKNNPNLLIGVGGCVASQEGEAIIKRAPYVDMVFGPQTLHRLPQMISERRFSGRPQVDISFPEIEKFDHMPPARVEGSAAYVSIMEGCSKYCSYCVVPYTRGEEVSRRFEDVLAEVAGLTAQGVKEVTLLGQNVNAFRGAMADGEIADFALLIEYIADIPGIERIRFVTSHPKEFTQRLIDTYAKVP
eukprot:gene20655-21330_t